MSLNPITTKRKHMNTEDSRKEISNKSLSKNFSLTYFFYFLLFIYLLINNNIYIYIYIYINVKANMRTMKSPPHNYKKPDQNMIELLHHTKSLYKRFGLQYTYKDVISS